MSNKSRVIWGCIADDFTGASDIASFFKKGGLRTILYNGIPSEASVSGFDAVVIALKSRTQETFSAVCDSLCALCWLKEQGAEHLYIKYCSTFDSTPKGNIGPIADTALEELNIKYTILCPALPVNGRTVRDGILYVNSIPLAESHMKAHPLTPMWDSSIKNLMAPQSKYPCFVMNASAMAEPDESISAWLDECCNKYEHFYIIPDFKDASDGERIAQLFGSLPLLTGGSGIAQSLASLSLSGRELSPEIGKTKGRALILAGSCSKATLSQISRFKADGGRAIKIFPLKLASGEQTIESIFKQIRENDEPVLVYSSDDIESIRKNQSEMGVNASELLEGATAELARLAIEDGFTRIIVAGGETSGAVIRKMGYSGYEIGGSVAPGIPSMMPVKNKKIRFVLKSGNFGDENFFREALEKI